MHKYLPFRGNYCKYIVKPTYDNHNITMGKKKTGTRSKEGQRSSDEFDPKTKELQSFLNQPNINMVLPWLYDIYKNIVKPDSSNLNKRGEEDPIL